MTICASVSVHAAIITETGLSQLDFEIAGRYYVRMEILISALINGLAVWIAAYVLPGVNVDGFFTAIVVAIILAIVNAVLRPILILLTIPVTVLSLGLFIFVINALLILLVARIVPGFTVDSFWWALAFSLVLSIVNSFLHSLSQP